LTYLEITFTKEVTTSHSSSILKQQCSATYLEVSYDSQNKRPLSS